jgi:hypothetical protein
MLNREALAKKIEEVKKRGCSKLADAFPELLEAAFSEPAEPGPWQPKVGDCVTHVRSGECGEVKSAYDSAATVVMNISGRQIVADFDRLRPAVIEPGDFVKVDGTKTGMVKMVESISEGCHFVLFSNGEYGTIADHRLTLLLKGRK